MAGKSKFELRTKDRDSYLQLIVAFPLVSIQSMNHLAAASKILDRLLTKGALSRGEEMYLDALSDLVATYEDKEVVIEPASDSDMLQHLMEAKGVTQAAICAATGLPKSSISEVLSGKKAFSRQMIRALADYFRVDIGILAANL